ncbi:hypothetical protein MGU_08865 [Metarhizium guizhouense ARSEF 977]|uniref:Uncharacterized protein n=1 Tax=Metarhizium guizhouense (strain ARSEF 977) TaxID=1276136 RepID=A0A0B4GEH8_METGA|nr:hypothetical protein MGU_11713 [Metarhizium guizhouense ARSEF 977]KID83893.1 hypothetical protein MGU_08865 [Metarhizium guizhouense ARSEF 977]
MAASPPLLRTTRRLQQTAETSPNNELKRKRAGRPGSWSKRRRTSPSPSASSTSPSASSIISSTSTCTSTDGDCDQLFVRQSLSAAMREHNRTRLYVQPIAWTCRHLMVLNVQFNLNPRLDACQHSLRVEGVPIKHEVLRAARQLRCESAEVQQIAMGEILKHYKLEELERSVGHPKNAMSSICVLHS